MSGGVVEIRRDVDPLVSGTYRGPNGSLVVRSVGADFRSCGVLLGSAVRNITDGSIGVVTEVNEDSFVCTLSGGIHDSFYTGDVYAVYMTATYDSIKSKHYVDRRYGHKVTDQRQLVDGIKPDEIDVDEYERNVFSPGQPFKK